MLTCCLIWLSLCVCVLGLRKVIVCCLDYVSHIRVNYAARISSIGVGGEIVISSTAWAHIRSSDAGQSAITAADVRVRHRHAVIPSIPGRHVVYSCVPMAMVERWTSIPWDDAWIPKGSPPYSGTDTVARCPPLADVVAALPSGPRGVASPDSATSPMQGKAAAARRADGKSAPSETVAGTISGPVALLSPAPGRSTSPTPRSPPSGAAPAAQLGPSVWWQRSSAQPMVDAMSPPAGADAGAGSPSGSGAARVTSADAEVEAMMLERSQRVSRVEFAAVEMSMRSALTAFEGTVRARLYVQAAASRDAAWLVAARRTRIEREHQVREEAEARAGRRLVDVATAAGSADADALAAVAANRSSFSPSRNDHAASPAAGGDSRRPKRTPVTAACGVDAHPMPRAVRPGPSSQLDASRGRLLAEANDLLSSVGLAGLAWEDIDKDALLSAIAN